MNTAQKVKKAFKTVNKTTTQSVRATALREDGNVEISYDDHMIFYRFSDKSVLGTRGRARGHQMWVVKNSKR